MHLSPAIALLCSLSVSALSLPSYNSPAQLPLQSRARKAYNGYELRRYALDGSRDSEALVSAAKRHELDVWALTPDHMDIYVHFGQLSSAVDMLFASQPYRVSTPSLSYPDQLTKKPTWDLTALNDTAFHASYHPLFEVEEFATSLAQLYPQQVELLKLGLSEEGREVGAIKIGNPGGKKVKPRIVIQGAQHAREWIATSTALYLAHALVIAQEKHSLGHLLDNWDFTIIPAPNPDGYVYTWDYDRLWYKNRSPIKGVEDCFGFDLNRNWGYQWSNESAPCSSWYPGPKPFSAPETVAISSYISRTPSIEVFLDLRSYGQMLMHPFSYSCDAVPGDVEDLIESSLGAAKALKSVHGTAITVGSLCEQLYSAPGNVVDWMYAASDIPFSYSLSLRDTGTYGFLLPPSWIRPVGEETSGMLSYLAHWVEKKRPKV